MAGSRLGGAARLRGILRAGPRPAPGGQPPDDGPARLPAGVRLIPDQGTRMIAGGSVLVGGSPVRVLRLTPAGSRQVASWFAGAPVPDGAGARTLARKLLDAGIAHPDFGAPASGTRGGDAGRALREPQGASGTAAGRGGAGERPAGRPGGPPGGSPGAPPASPALRFPRAAEVTVVIPVRDRHAELDRCLAGLRDLPRVIVVDDASADPAALRRIAAAHGATVIRRPVNGGPGAARNTGLGAAETEFVAFLDSDCVPKPDWLPRLLPHFADPAVGAVAPRIVPHEQPKGWLARYEGASSTLDMGARPSVVRPGARVPYVPGAALVVRRAAAGAGFRDGMYVGEDVDFVWRMSRDGWRVRYEPGAVMGHDHRVTFRAWFSRRADYGTSAAALEELHPGSVRPLYASWWTAGAWAAALAGRPLAAAALTAAATALLARRLARVTGERWPFPAPPADNSNKRDAPGPGGGGKQARQRCLGGMVDSFTPNREHNYPPSSRPSSWQPDNSIRRPARPEDEGSRHRLPGGGGAAWGLAVRLAAGGTVAAARPLGSALSRTWWPAAIPAALAVRRLRLPVAALILLPPLLDWADRRPPLDPARYVAARLLDDAAYSLGVWQGCLARRTARPLLPLIGGRRRPAWRLAAWPPGRGVGMVPRRASRTPAIQLLER
jgi:GT2 family glycosyltransferase